jgi:hypothetical protein
MGINKKKAVFWFLDAQMRIIFGMKKKYCTSCGWLILYYDDMYSPPETDPEDVAICSNLDCLMKYREYIDFRGEFRIITKEQFNPEVME